MHGYVYKRAPIPVELDVGVSMVGECVARVTTGSSARGWARGPLKGYGRKWGGGRRDKGSGSGAPSRQSGWSFNGEGNERGSPVRSCRGASAFPLGCPVRHFQTAPYKLPFYLFHFILCSNSNNNIIITMVMRKRMIKRGCLPILINKIRCCHVYVLFPLNGPHVVFIFFHFSILDFTCFLKWGDNIIIITTPTIDEGME